MEENVSFHVAEYVRKYVEKSICEFVCPNASVCSTSFDCVNVLSHAHILQTQKGLSGRVVERLIFSDLLHHPEMAG